MELSDLIASIDIVEYIGQFVDLEEKGAEFWGLSPFQQERTPSFSVRRDPPVFYDYSAGVGGGLFSFVKLFNHCGSGEAVDIIKKYAGVSEELSGPSQRLPATLVFKKFQKPKHLMKQGVNKPLPATCMDRFTHDSDKLHEWEKEGISMDTLDKFHVMYDGFSNRLVYPVRNISGDIVNIGGRTLDPDFKEKGLRKYTYFHGWGGSMNTIYGIFENMKAILQKREIILFEGCKSVLIAGTWGVQNCGAILTSHLNPNQMKILAKLGCRVVFALDKEINIRDDHNIQKLKNYVQVEYLWDREGLLNEKDSPVDKGIAVFQKLYEGRLRYR